MKTTIRPLGNSAGILIPKSVLEENGLKIGSTVEYTLNKPKKKLHKPLIDQEVYAVGNDLLRRYLPAFKKLAKPHDQISYN